MFRMAITMSSGEGCPPNTVNINVNRLVNKYPMINIRRLTSTHHDLREGHAVLHVGLILVNVGETHVQRTLKNNLQTIP